MVEAAPVPHKAMHSRVHVRVTGAEWRWAATVGVVVMAVTLLPYLYAAWLTPPGQRYVWLLYNPDDPSVHLSWIRQAADGHRLLVDPYTTEPQTARFFNLFMATLGGVVRVSGLSPVTVYHGARLAAGVGLFVALYWLTAWLTPNRRVRRLTVVLAATASGLGWAAPALNHVLHAVGLPLLDPPDLSRNLCMPEAVTFLSVYLQPLFTTSLLLLVLAYGWFLTAERTGRTRYAVASGAAALALGNIHTYDLFPFALALFVWCVWVSVRRRPAWWRTWVHAVVVAVLSAPAGLYQYFVFRQNEVFREKALTVTATPPVRDLAAAYGLLVPLALMGAWLVWRTRRRETVLPGIWIAATVASVYLPVSFQRKMVEGLHLPLCFLAAAAVGWLLPLTAKRLARKGGRSRRRLVRTGQAAVIVLLSLSNVGFVHLTMTLAMYNNRGFSATDTSRLVAAQPPYFVSETDLAAIRWLEVHTANEEVVFSAPYLGCYIPWLSGNRVFAGHWAETLSFGPKLHLVTDFYTGRLSPQDAGGMLRANGVRYVLYGAFERALSGDRPPRYPFLRPACIAPTGPVLYQVGTSP